MAATTLTRELDEAHVPYELMPHRRTDTAVGEARALHVRPNATAKTLVVRTDGGLVRAVVAAEDRLSLPKLRRVLDAREAELVDETVLAAAYPDFELGAVPPLGGPADRVVLDGRLALGRRIVFDAGTHEESARMRTDDVIRLAHATIADIRQD